MQGKSSTNELLDQRILASDLDEPTASRENLEIMGKTGESNHLTETQRGTHSVAQRNSSDAESGDAGGVERCRQREKG